MASKETADNLIRPVLIDISLIGSIWWYTYIWNQSDESVEPWEMAIGFFIVSKV